MSASYPSAVKTFTTKATGDKIQASHINDLQDEVHAIETDLLTGGITPTISDSDDSNVLTLATTSNLTADRTLTFVPGDASRTITLSGNPTLNDWFNQSVKSTAAPTFGSLTLNAGTNGSPLFSGTDSYPAGQALYSFGGTNEGDGAAANTYGMAIGINLKPDPNEVSANLLVNGTGTITTAASGTHGILAGIYVIPPTISDGGATVTRTATLYVTAAPTATVSDDNYALRVNTGKSYFGDLVLATLGFREHSRAFNAGDTQTPTFSAGNYTMDSGTWTVASGDVRGFSYRLIGDTCFLSLALDATTVSGTPGAELRVTLPVTAAEAMTAPVVCFDNVTNRNAIATVTASSTRLTIKRADGANWTASTNATSVFLTMAFKVS
jgi:hypothetical protein